MFANKSVPIHSTFDSDWARNSLTTLSKWPAERSKFGVRTLKFFFSLTLEFIFAWKAFVVFQCTLVKVGRSLKFKIEAECRSQNWMARSHFLPFYHPWLSLQSLNDMWMKQLGGLNWFLFKIFLEVHDIVIQLLMSHALPGSVSWVELHSSLWDASKVLTYTLSLDLSKMMKIPRVCKTSDHNKC